MTTHWLFLILAFVMLAYALARWVLVTRQLVEARREGHLMAHLDWTRPSEPARSGALRKDGLPSLFR